MKNGPKIDTNTIKGYLGINKVKSKPQQSHKPSYNNDRDIILHNNNYNDDIHDTHFGGFSGENTNFGAKFGGGGGRRRPVVLVGGGAHDDGYIDEDGVVGDGLPPPYGGGNIGGDGGNHFNSRYGQQV